MSQQQPQMSAVSTPGAQPQVVYVAGCQHDFVKSGEWSGKDWMMCLCFFPFNFCCCPPGGAEKCRKCGLNNASM